MLTKVKRIRKKYDSGKEVTTGGVDSIFGGPSELQEAEYKAEKLAIKNKRSKKRLALAKELRKENPDWSTKEVWNEINKQNYTLIH